MKTQDFDLFYSEFWKERWVELRASLLKPELQVARRNKFSKFDSGRLEPLGALMDLDDIFKVDLKMKNDLPRGEEGLLAVYIMDPASVWIARALGVGQGDTVLDMCAAPGGKSLILIEALNGAGELIANEPSPGRRERLTRVIQQYVPRDVRDRVRVSGKVGGLYARSHPDFFDKILVDAPCSGERHLLQNKTEFSKWSSVRSQRLAQEQYALVMAALHAVKPGGQVMYSTCSLSALENDGVVKRILKKKGAEIQILKLNCPAEGEESEFGVQFLPDRCGFGPLYACLLTKHR